MPIFDFYFNIKFVGIT